MGMSNSKNKFITEQCTLKPDTKPEIYVPKLTKTMETEWLRKFETAPEPGSDEAPKKVVMMVGGTGVGKTTMINGMVNYVMGVDWKDGFRVKLIEETDVSPNPTDSQTRVITAYTIHRLPGSQAPFTLQVIDTPGFGDTGGRKRDEEIAEQIKKFFSSAGTNGVDSLHAVGFVVRANDAVFNPTQQYIFKTVQDLFGKNFARNIFVLFSWCDADEPAALGAVKGSGMVLERWFKFNNSALFKGQTGRGGDKFNEMYWEMGMQSFRDFMEMLDHLRPQSLSLAKKVIEERDKLETAVEALRPSIKMDLEALDQLNKEKQILQKYQKEMNENKNFEVEVAEYVMKKVMVKKTLTQLKKKYERAQGQVMSTEQVIAECEKRIEMVTKETLSQVAKAGNCIKRLKEIALKPGAMTVENYIDKIISDEQAEKEDGWQDRVGHLQGLKTQAKKMNQKDVDADPFAATKIEYVVDQKTGLVKIAWNKI